MIPAILPVYRRSTITIVRGEGVYLYGPEEQRYLDFAAGIAVNSLGHCHPHLVKALQDQAATLWHCSNMYQMPNLSRLAERLVNVTFADSVFFCSTGAEAVEAGLKMIRKYQDETGAPERFRMITMHNGFHGRTMVGISAGGNALAREGFYPLVDGFDAVPLNDIAALENAITAQTAGILVEPIQGEGGIIPASHEFLHAARALSDAHGLALMCDEVQSGMGRTGALFAYEHAGIVPDVVATAKGIGSGFPLAACLASEKIARYMTPGSHGSTYGSNPLAMAVGNAVLDILLADGFLEQVRTTGAHFKNELEKLASEFPHLIDEVRGQGLLLGMHMRVPHHDFAATLRNAGLLSAPAYNNVIRFTPPLIITHAHIAEAITLLRTVCTHWK